MHNAWFIAGGPRHPSLRSPSELGNRVFWLQLHFHLSSPAWTDGCRHPWAPALFCAPLWEPHVPQDPFQSKPRDEGNWGRGWGVPPWRIPGSSCWGGLIPQSPLLGKSQKTGRPRLCSSSGHMGGLSQWSLAALLSDESIALGSAVI